MNHDLKNPSHDCPTFGAVPHNYMKDWNHNVSKLPAHNPLIFEHTMDSALEILCMTSYIQAQFQDGPRRELTSEPAASYSERMASILFSISVVSCYRKSCTYCSSAKNLPKLNYQPQHGSKKLHAVPTMVVVRTHYRIPCSQCYVQDSPVPTPRTTSQPTTSHGMERAGMVASARKHFNISGV